MNLTGFRSRIRRLEQLVAGLSKELNLWKDCDGPILYVDRLQYTQGIDQAIHGLETARLAMVKVYQRMRKARGELE